MSRFARSLASLGAVCLLFAACIASPAPSEAPSASALITPAPIDSPPSSPTSEPSPFGSAAPSESSDASDGSLLAYARVVGTDLRVRAEPGDQSLVRQPSLPNGMLVVVVDGPVQA